MIDVPHHGDDGGPADLPLVGSRFLIADEHLLHVDRDVLDLMVELPCDERRCVVIERLIDGRHHAHVEELLQNLAALDAHRSSQVTDRDHLRDADHALRRTRHRDLGFPLLLSGERSALLRPLAGPLEVALHHVTHVRLLDDLAALLLLGGPLTRSRLAGRRGLTRALRRRGGRHRGLAQVDLAEDLDAPHLLEARGRWGRWGRRTGGGSSLRDSRARDDRRGRRRRALLGLGLHGGRFGVCRHRLRRGSGGDARCERRRFHRGRRRDLGEWRRDGIEIERRWHVLERSIDGACGRQLLPLQDLARGTAPDDASPEPCLRGLLARRHELLRRRVALRHDPLGNDPLGADWLGRTRTKAEGFLDALHLVVRERALGLLATDTGLLHRRQQVLRGNRPFFR